MADGVDLADGVGSQPSLSQTHHSISMFIGFVFFVHALSLICNISFRALLVHVRATIPAVVTVWHLSIGPAPSTSGQSTNVAL